MSLKDDIEYVLSAMTPKQHTQCKDQIARIAAIFIPEDPQPQRDRGKHWALKRSTEKSFLYIVQGGDCDALTRDELMAKLNVSSHGLSVRFTQGGGSEFLIRRGDEIITIRKLSK